MSIGCINNVKITVTPIMSSVEIVDPTKGSVMLHISRDIDMPSSRPDSMISCGMRLMAPDNNTTL